MTHIFKPIIQLFGVDFDLDIQNRFFYFPAIFNGQEGTSQKEVVMLL